MLVFISHATADDARADEFHHALRGAGLETWVDHQRGIIPGDRWADKILDAINTCDCGLLLLSPASADSTFVDAEWNRILGLKKPLYIALITPVDLTKLPLLLDRIQYVDLTDSDPAAMTRLVEAIAGRVPLDGSPPVSLPTPPARARITGAYEAHLLELPMHGRDADVTAVTDLLAKAPVTLVGVGGLGKSRLAAEIVRRAGPHGAVWHRVGETSRADDVLVLLREHLDLAPAAERREVLAAVAKAPPLVVLDNGESAAGPDDAARRRDYAALVNDLRRAGAPVLLTSRVEWDEVRGRTHTPTPLTAEAGGRMARDHAEREGCLDRLGEHAEALATEARLHPRLIEWAAGKLSKFPLDNVMAELHGLDRRDVQTALDAMITTTLRQMSERDGETPAAVLRRLTLCRGGFTYAAARALAGLDDDDALDAALAALQAWQFVRLRGVRYEIDPLVIAAAGEDGDAVRAHADYYKRLARAHHGRQDYAGLDVESANLEAAFERLLPLDPEAAYWLANACLDFLANRGRFALWRDWMERAAAALAAGDDAALRAGVQVSLGIVYWEQPTGSREANLRRAIQAYETALAYFTPEVDESRYAVTQNNLGIAYLSLSGIEDREANLRKAIQAYETALVYYTPDAAPLQHAATQNNLGIAYSALSGIEDREANLRRAIQAYETALVYRTPDAAPLDHATTQNNLGNAYSDLSGIEDREANLRKAIQAYETALVYRTPDAAPPDHPMTQYNLGTAYWSLAAIEDREANLRKAIQAFETALVYYTPDAAPLDHADTQWNLGLVLKDLGDLAGTRAAWAAAEAICRAMGFHDDAETLREWIEDADRRLAGSEDEDGA